jgi:hypothetical protein
MPTHDRSNLILTRRRILGIGSAGAVGGLACYLGWPSGKISQTAAVVAPRQGFSVAPADIPETSPSEPALVPGALRRDDFLPHLNTRFQLGTAGDTCMLIEVGDARKLVSPTAEYVSFSLLFAAPAGSAIDGVTQLLRHPKLDTMELFISPVGQSKEHVHLEAICCQRI